MGGRALAAAARKKLRIDFGETTADGQVSLRPIYCLGKLCLLSKGSTLAIRSILNYRQDVPAQPINATAAFKNYAGVANCGV